MCQIHLHRLLEARAVYHWTVAWTEQEGDSRSLPKSLSLDLQFLSKILWKLVSLGVPCAKAWLTHHHRWSCCGTGECHVEPAYQLGMCESAESLSTQNCQGKPYHILFSKFTIKYLGICKLLIRCNEQKALVSHQFFLYLWRANSQMIPKE